MLITVLGQQNNQLLKLQKLYFTLQSVSAAFRQRILAIFRLKAKAM